MASIGTLRDPAGGAPRLRADLHLGTVWDLPDWSVGPRGHGDELYETIARAGYEAVQGGDPTRCAAKGMSATTFGVARTAEGLYDQAALWRDLGFEAATLHVGTGLEDRDDGLRLLADVVAASIDTGLPLYVETHRATITQDLWRTVDFVGELPELRFNGDFSHWYTGLEMPYGDFEAKVAFLEPVFERTRYLHGRIGSPGCIQIDIGQIDIGQIDIGAHDAAAAEPDEPPSVAHFRTLWTAAARGFLSGAVDGDVLGFAPELLPASIHYARTIPGPTAEGGAQEEGDRWTQALRLVEIARSCFAAAQSDAAPTGTS